MGSPKTSRERAGQRSKSIEEVVTYALSHRTRVEILILLAQGTYSAAEVAQIIGKPLNRTAHHLGELADGGAIEIARVDVSSNFHRHYYRAVEIPMYTKDQMREMNVVERQNVVGFILQSLLAEALGSLWAGKMSADPDVMVVWDRLNLDDEGRQEVTEEQERHFARMNEIEHRSLVRAALTESKTTPHMVAVLGFERALKAPVAPGSANAD